MTTLLLALLLASPPTLGDGLRAVGAFDAPPEDGLDHSLDAPPPPARWGAKALVLTGVTMVLTGVVGQANSGGCEARGGDGKCVSTRSSAPVFPILAVAGLGVAITGSYWLRQDVAEAPP